MIPVFTYYQLLQSKPGGGDEAHADLANLRDADTMHAYWADLELFFRRAAGTEAGRPARRARPLGLHRAGLERRRCRERSRGRAGRASAERGRVRPGVRAHARSARAERDPRLAHERVGDEARRRDRGSARSHRRRVRDAVGCLLPVAGRCLRPLVRGLLRSRRRLLREGRGQRDDVVQGRRLPPAPAVRAHVRAARRHPHGGLADPARQHRDAGDGRHDRATTRTTACSGCSRVRAVGRTCAPT